MLHFLGIGAQKAGTTWLYQCLRQHPELHFPKGKEVHFWDRWRHGQEVASYFAAFSGERRLEGEITPAYAMLPREVIAELAGHAPGLRLIYLIRNPVERAWSSALMALGRAEMRYEEASAQWFVDHFRSSGSLGRGDYARCLENWWSVFPAEALLVRDYAEISDAPDHLLGAVCEHLGVAAPPAAVRDVARERAFAGPGHPLPAELRAVLEELYAPRIARLERCLGRSFQHWLSP